MDTKTKVKDVVVKLLKVKPDELKEGQNLETSLGVDSTEMVEICIALQKEFGVHLEEKEVTKYQTLDEIAGVIDKKKI
ncbi:MAG: acyl carrier protein [Candidatus Omnitrophica bacterium]|nr:acyl carrier protein [Candidatus Omnitrophota bacterium]MDD5574920.1 acyl carrier protein [Candidatus Omnitrophota bacterium]